MARNPRRAKEQEQAKQRSRRLRGDRSWGGEKLDDSFEGLRKKYKEIQRIIRDLSYRSEELRIMYDRYFLGLLKREPMRERIQFERELKELKVPDGAPAALRFRHQVLLERIASYKRYWARCARQIEEGTFRRRSGGAPAAPQGAIDEDDEALDAAIDEAARRHAGTKGGDQDLDGNVGAEPPTTGGVDGNVGAEPPTTGGVDGHVGAEPPTTGGSRRRRRKDTIPDQLPPWRRLYDAYVEAHVDVGAEDKLPAFETFARSIEKQRTRQMDRYDAADISYEVRKESGRVKLVAKLTKKTSDQA